MNWLKKISFREFLRGEPEGLEELAPSAAMKELELLRVEKVEGVMWKNWQAL